MVQYTFTKIGSSLDLSHEPSLPMIALFGGYNHIPPFFEYYHYDTLEIVSSPITETTKSHSDLCLAVKSLTLLL